MKNEILEAMQGWLDNRNEMVDKTIDNINNEAEKGNEKAKELKALDVKVLMNATDKALNK